MALRESALSPRSVAFFATGPKNAREARLSGSRASRVMQVLVRSPHGGPRRATGN
jgi:hypothetical protein